METTTGSSLDSDGEQEGAYDGVAGGPAGDVPPALLRAISADVEHTSPIPGTPGSNRKIGSMVRLGSKFLTANT